MVLRQGNNLARGDRLRETKFSAWNGAEIGKEIEEDTSRTRKSVICPFCLQDNCDQGCGSRNAQQEVGREAPCLWITTSETGGGRVSDWKDERGDDG